MSAQAQLVVNDGADTRPLDVEDLQGSDGTSAPTLPNGSTGTRGWLRLVYDTLTSVFGGAGTSPPSLASGASGVIGYLRKIVDLAISGVVVKTDNASPLLVDSRAGQDSQITSRAVNGVGDGAGDVVTYTETLPSGTVLAWTDTYNSDGTLHSHVHA